MRSIFLARRLIAFDSSDTGAAGGGAAVADAGAAPAAAEVTDDAAGGAPKVDDKKGEEKPERSEWQKRIDALRGVGVEENAKKDGETTPEGGKKPDAAAAPAKPGEKKVESDDADDATKPLTIKVPGRKAEDPDVELPLDRAALKALGITAKEARDRMGQLRNGYARKQEIEAGERHINEGRSQLEAIEREMQENPVPFFTDRVDPKQYLPLTQALIARLSDDEFVRLITTVATYDADPSKRRLAEAKAIKDSTDRERQTAEATKRNVARNEYVAQVEEQINGLTPDDMSDDDKNDFYEYATMKMATWARTQPKGTRLDPAKVPELLDSLGVLSRFSLSREPESSATPPKKSATPPGKGAPPPKKPAVPPKDTGADLKERRDRRAEAATATPGAGPTATASPPKGQTFKERMKWFRGT